MGKSKNDSDLDSLVLIFQNVSLHYSTMLLVQALIRLLSLWSLGVLDSVPEDLLKTRIPVVLIQALNQCMCTQRSDGSWGTNPYPEATAYALITLKETAALPWTSPVSRDLHFAIQSGQRFLEKCHGDWKKPQYLWIEKVTFGVPTLSVAYCLAAVKPLQKVVDNWADRVQNLITTPEEVIAKFTGFMSMVSIFENVPSWKMKLSAIEGLLFLPLLKSTRADILPRQKDAKNKYLNYVPLTWIIVNNTRDLFLPANLLWDMMVLSVCNFRVDEYMETSVAAMNDAALQKTKTTISELCTVELGQPVEKETRKIFQEDSASEINDTSHDHVNENPDESDFKAVIGHYIEAMLSHPSILHASRADISSFRAKIEEFLLSHVDQLQDNKRFKKQVSWSASNATIFETPRLNFLRWLQTTGADSVSAPMSFAFLTCLLGASANESSTGRRERMDCFTTIGQKYLAHDLSARLAVTSRLYNDYGSIARDLAEANINCANFAEFHTEPMRMESESTEEGEVDLKKKVLVLAQYEREFMDHTGMKLINALKSCGRAREEKIGRAVALFMGTAALYADMYVVRDLSNQVQRT